MNAVSSRMGLRRHPLPKPTAASNDLLEFPVAHLVHCNSVFADEKQRLYLLAASICQAYLPAELYHYLIQDALPSYNLMAGLFHVLKWM